MAQLTDNGSSYRSCRNGRSRQLQSVLYCFWIAVMFFV